MVKTEVFVTPPKIITIIEVNLRFYENGLFGEQDEKRGKYFLNYLMR